MRPIDADALLKHSADLLITDGKGGSAKYRCIGVGHVHEAPTLEQPVAPCKGLVLFFNDDGSVRAATLIQCQDCASSKLFARKNNEKGRFCPVIGAEVTDDFFCGQGKPMEIKPDGES